MSYGLRVTNPGAELVISSDAKGLVCIGRAVLQGAVLQPAGSATTTYPGRIWGGSTYRIAWPGPIIAAIDLPLNKRVGIMSVTQPSAGVWDIQCHCGDAIDGYGFDAQTAVDVWAFGLPSAPAAGVKMAIWSANGALAYDLSRPAQLWPRGYALSTGSALTIPALIRPVVMGCPSSWFVWSDGALTIKRYAVQGYRKTWKRTASTSMVEAQVTRQRYEYSATEPRDLNEDSGTQSVSCFILEGSSLP